jgi:DNA-directed RNA polymerase II subunit RPB2
MDFDKDTWTIIDSYFRDNSNYLVKHHLDSYNDFIGKKIPLILQQYNPQIHVKELIPETDLYKYETHVSFGGEDGTEVFIGKPVIYSESTGSPDMRQMYPNEARLKNLTYAAHIMCNVSIKYLIRDETDPEAEPEVITKNFEKVVIGKIPIMLHSKACVLRDLPFNLRREMGECPYDQGGYFVIDGAEKVIVSHERKAENKLYILESNDMDNTVQYSAQIKSVPDDSFKFARTTVVNVNRYIQNDFERREGIKSDNCGPMTVRLPMMRKQIPLFIVFRLLGVESDLEIFQYILGRLTTHESKLFIDDLQQSVLDTGPVFTQVAAIKYCANLSNGNSISHILDVIRTDLFPHIGDNFVDKAYYLGYLVNKILCVRHKIEPPTDRDSFLYKRVDLSGFLLANLFRESYKQFQRDSKIAIDTEYRFNTNQYQGDNYSNIINSDNLTKMFDPMVIEKTFMKSFKIGTILNKVGLVQALNRLSSVGAVSHLRRINTPDTNVMIGQRKLHGTQYGFICAAETPDGSNIGIKKHMTMLAHITFGCSAKPIIKLCYEMGVVPLASLPPTAVFKKVKVFVNGNWIGIHEDPKRFVELMKLYRRNGVINIFTSISWNIQMMEIHFLTDSGRLCRPMYVLEDNQIKISAELVTALKSEKLNWSNLVSGINRKETIDYYNCDYICPIDEATDADTAPVGSSGPGEIVEYSLEKLKSGAGVIDFLDTDELINCHIVNTPSDIDSDYNYEYCELHPCLILGALGFTIPFSNMSQAPRNVYGTGQTKQSVGVYTSNYRNRMDGTANVLMCPQKPLIQTRLSKYTMVNDLPTGINAIVAIACYSGYNQEDSVIFNKSSMERGLFRSFYFKTYSSSETADTRDAGFSTFFSPEKTDTSVNLKSEYNYTKVDENGFVKEGIQVTDNDVLISKYSSNGFENMDDSEVVKPDGTGVVDKVFSDYMNTNNLRMCKVRVVSTREPALGDKFASRHGQKGTVGMVLREEDMPYSRDGIVPDIIVNPHAFPSRMTLGQFLESVIGKTCACHGFYSDGTPFTDIDIEPFADVLEKKYNYEKYGNEVLYNGIFGTQIQCSIFMGPTYYQRLKHMVKDKVNSRARGKMTMKNRQPPSGRSAGGGLRIGEMERDAVIAHGALQFLKESTMERSDKYEMYLSENSGQIAVANPSKNRYVCPNVDGPLEFNSDTLELESLNSKKTDIVKVEVPYNVKMMSQECEAMGISMRLVVRGKAEPEEMVIRKPTRFIPQIKQKVEAKTKTIPDKKPKRKAPAPLPLSGDKPGEGFQAIEYSRFKVGDEVIVVKKGFHYDDLLCVVVGIIGSGADKKYELKVVEVDKTGQGRTGAFFQLIEYHLRPYGVGGGGYAPMSPKSPGFKPSSPRSPGGYGYGPYSPKSPPLPTDFQPHSPPPPGEGYGYGPYSPKSPPLPTDFQPHSPKELETDKFHIGQLVTINTEVYLDDDILVQNVIAEVIDKLEGDDYKLRITEEGYPPEEITIGGKYLEPFEPKSPELPPSSPKVAPVVVETTGVTRSDIDRHEEVWQNVLTRTYTEEELRRMSTLAQSYNLDELKKLGIDKNLYVIVDDEDFDRSLLFKVIPEEDDRVETGRYYTPIHLAGFNLDAGLEVGNVYKLVDYNQMSIEVYSPTYLPGDPSPLYSPRGPEGPEEPKTKGKQVEPSVFTFSQSNIEAAGAPEGPDSPKSPEEPPETGSNKKLEKYNIKFVKAKK